MKKRVFLTGLTSFSGCHIASALLKENYDLIAPLRKPSREYEGIKAQRLNLARGAQLINACDIGGSELIQVLRQIKPKIFMNHGGYIENYRSPDFDFLKHLETNLANIKLLIETLKIEGCELFVHSGSAFEPGEEYSRYGVSPYGVAKKMVWDMTVYWCAQIGLPVVKVVIPNPYGYLENEDRLLPVFTKLIKENKPLKLTDPDTIRNNIEIGELAKYYVQAVQMAESALPKDFVFIMKPLGHIETQKAFVFRALQEEPYNLKLEQIENALGSLSPLKEQSKWQRI